MAPFSSNPSDTGHHQHSSSSIPMEEEEEKKKKRKHHQHPPASPDLQFKPSSDVKGIRFGAQFVVRSFTVRRAAPLELLRLLNLPPPQPTPTSTSLPFPSTAAYLPTNFTVLAHHAWHTLTLGLGTRKSKVVVFVFESEAVRSSLDRVWPQIVPLGEVNRRMVRGLSGCEMARFKFRKGALTFYVYAVRRSGVTGFVRAEDLRAVLEAVVALRDFVDHTALLAMPSQRSIEFSGAVALAK